eukprot:scaffold248548_cov77-Cyclotella_meneghiniana.AAC.2
MVCWLSAVLSVVVVVAVSGIYISNNMTTSASSRAARLAGSEVWLSPLSQLPAGPEYAYVLALCALCANSVQPAKNKGGKNFTFRTLQKH